MRAMNSVKKRLLEAGDRRPSIKLMDATEDLPFRISKLIAKTAESKNHFNCAVSLGVLKTYPDVELVYTGKSGVFLLRDEILTRYRHGSGIRDILVMNDSGGAIRPGEYWLKAKPEPSEPQKVKILNLLRAAGTKGISRRKLVSMFAQPGARIDDLMRSGYKITSRYVGCDRWVTYFLISEPSRPVKLLPRKSAVTRKNKRPDNNDDGLRASA